MEYKDQSDIESSGEEEDDSDDEECNGGEEYKRDLLKEYSSEEFHDNYNFIKMMTSVERDDLNLIYDDKHVTLPILTKYEKARVLGLRISPTK